MNGPTTDAGLQLVKDFEVALKDRIIPAGFWPYPLYTKVRGKADYTIVNCEIPAPKAPGFFATSIRNSSEILAAIIGVDLQVPDPEQVHLELPDVLACIYYEKPSEFVALPFNRSQFSFGVVEYAYRPRIIKPINWNNRYWIHQLTLELANHVPAVELSDRLSRLVH